MVPVCDEANQELNALQMCWVAGLEWQRGQGRAEGGAGRGGSEALCMHGICRAGSLLQCKPCLNWLLVPPH